MDLTGLSAVEISKRVITQEASCEEYVSQSLEKASRLNPRLNAFITLCPEEALARARLIDMKAKRGERLGILAGVTVAVKDNICTKGLRTTCASRMLERFMPPYDATVIERIVSQGGVIIGKTNMDEFAMGTTTESSAFGPVVNPLNEECTPGGSSGGSGAAVAAGIAALALGSDTGGSIRCPASFCSIVGLKPTYGLVSRYGLIAYANSLEQIGPMASDVAGVSILLSAIAGHDPRDGTSVMTEHHDYLRYLKAPRCKLRLALLRESMEAEGTQHVVQRTVREAISKFEEFGAVVEEVSVASLEYALAAYYIIAMAEASSNLARYDGVRYGGRQSGAAERDREDWNAAYSRTRSELFGAEVKRRILLGTFALSAGYSEAYYLRAQKIRTMLRNELASVFKRFDLLATPTMPVLPPRLRDEMSPLEEYAMDVNTVPANLVGLPAVSVPCGSRRSHPIGLQLMAPHFREDLLLESAHAYESVMSHG